MTPHNSAKIGDIAKTVLMPGDPLRAKVIAEKFLEDCTCFNTVRNMLGFTGTYNGVRVSVMGSGIDVYKRQLLKHIAGNLRDYADEQKLCTYGRIEADVFGICMRYIDEESSVKAVRDIRKRLVDYDLRFGIIPTFGIYVVDDAELPVNLMYDRANLAAKNCKGNFVKFYAFYNSNMSDRLMKEQTIINEMDGALVNGQFCLYFQPKYDLRTRCV